MSVNSILKHMGEADIEPTPSLNDKERELAERIFFTRHLKECNAGISDEKVRGRIRKAIATAQMLYKEIYGV